MKMVESVKRRKYLIHLNSNAADSSAWLIILTEKGPQRAVIEPIVVKSATTAILLPFSVLVAPRDSHRAILAIAQVQVYVVHFFLDDGKRGNAALG